MTAVVVPFFSRLTDLNNCAGITVNSGSLSYLPSLNVSTQTKVNSFFSIFTTSHKKENKKRNLLNFNRSLSFSQL